MNQFPDDRLTRRSALTRLTVGGAAFAVGCSAQAQQTGYAARDGEKPSNAQSTSGGETTPAAATAPDTTPPAALAGQHQPVPLPFAPSSLNGLSERLITSHHENNYGGAVKNLNRVERELAAITPETPGLVVAALRGRELMFRNSKMLHEAYFANLGGDGRRSGAIEQALSQAYGSSDGWEAQFRATAGGLGGGSGWVVLALELDSGRLRTFGSGDHTQALGLAVPLLVLDMYEHSYHMDFGAAAARYVDAFFANIQWDEVNRRLESAQQAHAALQG